MTESAAIYEQDLPPLLKEIQELIGIQATLALVEHYGGIPLLVPRRYRDDHPLVRVVGHAQAAKLIERYGGDKLYVAKLDHAMRVLRNIEISQRYECGCPVKRLAREYGLSERQIWNILKRPETLRQPPAQRSLFDDNP